MRGRLGADLDRKTRLVLPINIRTFREVGSSGVMKFAIKPFRRQCVLHFRNLRRLRLPTEQGLYFELSNCG